MNEALLLSIIAAGFTVAFFHAALPTHWLPFVVASRNQSWSRSRTLAITAFAGIGHILITTLLGALLLWFGMNVDRLTGSIFPLLGGGLLVLLGAFYIYRGMKGRHMHLLPGSHGHDDAHEHEGHSHAAGHAHRIMTSKPRAPDRVVIVGLFTLLTLSPCEAFLPVYLSAARYGWTGFALLSVVLAIATIVGMVTFTALTLAGLEKINLGLLEKYEGVVLGSVLCLLGIALVVLEH